MPKTESTLTIISTSRKRVMDAVLFTLPSQDNFNPPDKSINWWSEQEGDYDKNNYKFPPPNGKHGFAGKCTK